MIIQRLELFRFTPFQFNNVELLEIDFPASIQNIIGTNGSGKTSLLREINPLPAARPDFGKDGFKRIWILHNGSDYVLGSNFSEPSSPHSFVKDEVELNVSGTTGVQEELVAKELGYTKLVHDLAYGEWKLSRMPVGSRKTFLHSIHPSQMKLIYEMYKTLMTRLRACRNNLSMLHERRAALTVQMIDQSLKQELISESEKLSHEIGLIVQAIGQVSNQRRTVQQSILGHAKDYTIRSLKERNAARRIYPLFKTISRETISEFDQLNIEHDISVTKSNLNNVAEQASNITREIDKYEEHIRQNDAQGAIDLIEETINTLRSDIEDLSKDPLVNPFDHFSMDAIPGHLSRLTDLVGFFIGYSAPIPAMKDVQKLKYKLDINIQQLHHTDRDVTTLTTRLHTVGINLSAQIIKDIPQGCQGCILFKRYHETTSRIQSDYDQIERAHRMTARRQMRLQRLVEDRRNRLSLYNQAVPQLQRLSDYLNEYRFLMVPLQGIDLLSTLRSNPAMLLVRLERHYQRSQDYYRLQEKKRELDRLVMDYEKLQSPPEFGREFLTKMVAEKYQELHRKQAQHQTLLLELEGEQKYFTLLINYREEVQCLYRELSATETEIQRQDLLLDLELCDRCLQHLEKTKLQTIGRLTEIDGILKEQDALSARYHQEVLVNIDKITSEEKEYTLLEEALSPTSGIPDRYMFQFVSDLIATANVFMTKVFSYPLEFIPLKEGEFFDYKFRMQVGDVVIPDISDGSEAQKEMAELAFTLAMIIQLKQTTYGLYLDECDKALDSYHKQHLLTFLKSLTEDGIVSQLFMINHNAVVYGGMGNADITVLNDANIVLPEVYNENVHIERY